MPFFIYLFFFLLLLLLYNITPQLFTPVSFNAAWKKNLKQEVSEHVLTLVANCVHWATSHPSLLRYIDLNSRSNSKINLNVFIKDESTTVSGAILPG